MEKEYPLCTLLIEVTQKCNAACDQCGSRCDIHSREFLSKEEILNALRDIKTHLGTDTMINITGGEPLLRQDLFEIGREISAMGFHWGMVTNGSLITDAVIENMKQSGMKTVTVSVDGLRETHDTLRHLPGCFDKITAAIVRLRQADFLDHIQVTFTANKKNVHEFESLYAILNKLGLDSVRVGLMDPIGRAKEHENLLLSREEIIYFTGLVNRINEDKKNTPIVWGCPHFMGRLTANRAFHCFAGIYTASILYNGDIFVCPNVPRLPELIQGNILTDSFSEVWRHRFLPFRNRKLPEKCEGCYLKEVCKGDSFHTLDYKNGTPRFCYRDYIRSPDPAFYKNSLSSRYPGMSFYTVGGEDEKAPEVFIEPEAFADMSRYFHFNKRHPSSLYEQQMALIGFVNGNVSVVRYVIPCDGKLRIGDNAVFTNDILKTVQKELNIINKNYFISDDRFLRGCELDFHHPMRFLGFVHSHPVQRELQYSTGDERIHRRMYKKYGHYIGILVNPADGTMGAYIGGDIKQAKLIIPKEDFQWKH